MANKRREKRTIARSYNRKESEMIYCCYCNAIINDGGNRAYDYLHEETRNKVCCDTCNSLIVAPIRCMSMYIKDTHRLEYIKHCITDLQDFVKEREKHERSDMS